MNHTQKMTIYKYVYKKKYIKKCFKKSDTLVPKSEATPPWDNAQGHVTSLT